ncbi:lipoate--protein ligase family protein [Atopococcus tabaci]|uniref:lipoate--protein ligase family protein n=1 Tax=Atopococcus tabaci TaxID=269774 RepID=UPI0003F62FE5|nr:lipoate--protein ligase family protein [Atopococcus tabaci]
MSNDLLSYLLNNQTIRVYEAQTMPFSNQTISHFALADSLLADVGQTRQPVLHIWPTQELVILGMADTKLPHFGEALSVFQSYGYDYIVRNSGGLAVVGDEGVLNFSLIIPDKKEGRLPINTAYDLMLQLVQEMFREYSGMVEAYEISDSYCPGDYDLSVNGQKIAGISQRRVKNGLAIMIYISVNGDQTKRASMIKEFYEQGLQGESVKWTFPDIDPSVMTTVEKAFKMQLTVEKVVSLLKETLEEKGAALSEGVYTETIRDEYDTNFTKMIKRNRQMLGDYVQEEVLK